MAKVKLALRAFDEVIDDMPNHIAKLTQASGLKPVEMDLEYSGSIGIDREGGVDAGGEASGNLIEAASGVPVSVKAGFRSGWDNTGGAQWKLRVRFG